MNAWNETVARNAVLSASALYHRPGRIARAARIAYSPMETSDELNLVAWHGCTMHQLGRRVWLLR
jgi:hypothetical protein